MNWWNVKRIKFRSKIFLNKTCEVKKEETLKKKRFIGRIAERNRHKGTALAQSI